jgi:lysophospholipase
MGLKLSHILPLLCYAHTVASSNPYAPTFVSCPNDLSIRPACGLSDQERAWRSRRLPEVVKSLKTYLHNANIPGFDTAEYLAKIDPSNVPIAGLAISGGGSQSGMTGLGIYQAFDDRYEAAVKAGSGGLVQCLSYFSGLSGGGLTTVLPL